jgi:hypothetical protein
MQDIDDANIILAMVVLLHYIHLDLSFLNASSVLHRTYYWSTRVEYTKLIRM